MILKTPINQDILEASYREQSYRFIGGLLCAFRFTGVSKWVSLMAKQWVEICENSILQIRSTPYYLTEIVESAMDLTSTK